LEGQSEVGPEESKPSNARDIGDWVLNDTSGKIESVRLENDTPVGCYQMPTHSHPLHPQIRLTSAHHLFGIQNRSHRIIKIHCAAPSRPNCWRRPAKIPYSFRAWGGTRNRGQLKRMMRIWVAVARNMPPPDTSIITSQTPRSEESEVVMLPMMTDQAIREINVQDAATATIDRAMPRRVSATTFCSMPSHAYASSDAATPTARLRRGRQSADLPRFSRHQTMKVPLWPRKCGGTKKRGLLNQTMNEEVKQNATVPTIEDLRTPLITEEIFGSSRRATIPTTIMTAIKACAAPPAILPRWNPSRNPSVNGNVFIHGGEKLVGSRQMRTPETSSHIAMQQE
jgi:hypothetical protein